MAPVEEKIEQRKKAICEQCRKGYTKTVFWQKYCSNGCKHVAWGLKEAGKVMRKSLLIIGFFICGSQNLMAQPDFNKIADSIYLAEGGAKAKKPFGILSVPCSGYVACRKICLNTVRNNYRRWQNAGSPGDYLEFLASRYAPAEAHPLNRNWLSNVRYFLKIQS